MKYNLEQNFERGVKMYGFQPLKFSSGMIFSKKPTGEKGELKVESQAKFQVGYQSVCFLNS